MTRPCYGLILFGTLAATQASGQFAAGFVDPEPVLKAAAAAIGTDKFNCVTIAGSGYAGAVGQQKEAGWNIDWPRGEALANYRRTLNWKAGTSLEEFERPPGRNPASWKYGSGWLGGTPLQQHSRQTFAVNGKQASFSTCPQVLITCRFVI